jgi:hypothetical protein
LLHWRVPSAEPAFAPRNQSEVPRGLGLVPSVGLIRTASWWRNGRTKYSVSSLWLERRPIWPTCPTKGCVEVQPQMQKKAVNNSRRRPQSSTAMNNKSPARQLPFTPLRTCVFKASAGQKNDVGETKKASEQQRSEAQRNILPPWLGYPLLGCSPAEPDSVSPSKDNVHEQKNEAKRFERKTYVQTQKLGSKNNWKPPLDANFSFREVAPGVSRR